MNKKIVLSILFCLIAISFNCTPLQGYNEARATGHDKPTFDYYPNTLHRVIEKIHQLPEIRELLCEIQNEGKIRIGFRANSPLQAYWDSYRRMIILSPSQNRTEGDCISSILFELHNAIADKEFRQLRNLAASKVLSKEQYIENVERLEHQNALSTCRLLKKGIRTGIFPRCASWSVYENFDDHFRVQKMCGHSDWIAKCYDRLVFI